MPRWTETKIRCDETWEEVRRAWEAGETAASLARRYDVGLANLWRRRASEHWERRAKPDPVPEPVEGWERHAAAKVEAWEGELAATRELALDLMTALEGGPLEVSVWHLGWLLRMRAERLGPEVAARDRARAEDEPWAVFWDEQGVLKRQSLLDWETMRLWRDDWRARAGLPEGVVPHCP